MQHRVYLLLGCYKIKQEITKHNLKPFIIIFNVINKVNLQNVNIFTPIFHTKQTRKK